MATRGSPRFSSRLLCSYQVCNEALRILRATFRARSHRGKIKAKAMSESNEFYTLTLRTYLEIGDANFNCVLWTFKQQVALKKCEHVVEFPLFFYKRLCTMAFGIRRHLSKMFNFTFGFAFFRCEQTYGVVYTELVAIALTLVMLNSWQTTHS